jgi:hypothetical protein
MYVKQYSLSTVTMFKTFCTLALFLLKEAVVVNEWAGLRPGRSEVRLERDHVRDKYGNKLEVCIKIYAILRHRKLLY